VARGEPSEPIPPEKRYLICTAKCRICNAMPTVTRKRSAAPSRTPSTARLEARIPYALMETLREARQVTGAPSVTAYVVQILKESAERVVHEARLSRLEAAESLAFVQSLLAPEAPNGALQAAAARYRDQVG
jgi:uncharacterized protein (DUF1778 family)